MGKPREGSEITVDAYGRRVSAEDERRSGEKVGGVKDKTGRRSWIKNVLFSFFPTRAEDHRRHGCQRKWCVGMKGADGTKKRRMSSLCRSLSR